MRALIAVLLLIASGCSSAVTESRPIFVAEGFDHVTMIATLVTGGDDGEMVVRAAAEAMRDAPGNLAVSVLRGANGELTLTSEWLTEAHARDAARLLKTAEPQYFEVLFESSQFPADR
jgi:hypothetical protein